jgi:uncharacterized membrane protein YedE/YeeE
MDGFFGIVGGTMIGLGAVTLMAVLGRIAGISGIMGGLYTAARGEPRGDILWRLTFLASLVAGAALATLAMPGRLEPPPTTGWGLLLAGALVGFGAVYGNGCTSGHGVCGLARLSTRSAVAVGVFMLTAILTVGIMRHGF